MSMLFPLIDEFEFFSFQKEKIMMDNVALAW